MRDEAGSTNDEAALLAASGGMTLPFAVRALRQTSGRGQAGRAWWSDSGSLALTVALDPGASGLRESQEPRVALATAACLALRIGREIPALAGQIGVRWPNDLEAGGRKVGGILTERAGGVLLVGVGLNVTTDFASATDDIRGMADSLAGLAGGSLGEDAPGRAAGWVCEEVERAVNGLTTSDAWLAEAWNRLDTLAGCPVRVERAGRLTEGIGLGIDADGCLRLGVRGGVEVVAAGRILRE
ncbi:biotin--[acetyl-CoA-carboxylase] ligase [Isosphaeraceae bacterium EP7]